MADKMKVEIWSDVMCPYCYIGKRRMEEEAKERHRHITQLAKEYGLDYDFEKAKPANTFKAHQLLHFAKENGKADQAEELLFRAYLCEGKNVNDEATLLDLSQALDLDPVAFKSILQKGTYIKEIEADIAEAKSLGLKGVPFFVFNKKVAVFGGQEPEKFVEILQNALADWEEDQKAPQMKFIDGAVCTPDGECN